MVLPVSIRRAVLAKVENARAKSYTDPYVVRLQQIVPGMLNPGNLYAYEHVFSHLATRGAIVEIGSFAGLSTNLITYFMRQHGLDNTFMTCDRWDYSFKGLSDAPIVPGSPVTGVGFGRYAKETFMRNCGTFSPQELPYTMEVYSDEFFGSWSARGEVIDVFGRSIRLGGAISFAFIDGNHEYTFVARDFANVDRHLEIGGWLLFDDSADMTGSPGPRRLMRELKREGIIGARYEVVMRNPHYLLRKLVH